MPARHSVQLIVYCIIFKRQLKYQFRFQKSNQEWQNILILRSFVLIFALILTACDVYATVDCWNIQKSTIITFAVIKIESVGGGLGGGRGFGGNQFGGNQFGGGRGFGGGNLSKYTFVSLTSNKIDQLIRQNLNEISLLGLGGNQFGGGRGFGGGNLSKIYF